MWLGGRCGAAASQEIKSAWNLIVNHFLFSRGWDLHNWSGGSFPIFQLFPPAAAHHGWSQLATGWRWSSCDHDQWCNDPGPESLSRTKFQVLSCRCVKLDQFYRFPPIHDLPAAGMLGSVCGKVWEPNYGCRAHTAQPYDTSDGDLDNQSCSQATQATGLPWVNHIQH